jgi:hypothetical protein
MSVSAIVFDQKKWSHTDSQSQVGIKEARKSRGNGYLCVNRSFTDSPAHRLTIGQ